MRLKRNAAIIADDEYRALAEFRHQIRRFLHLGDQIARAVGIEPRQYELLLAIRGIPLAVEPTIGAIADQLRLRHHSAVELVNRAEVNGLVSRFREGTRVFVQLTTKGERIVANAVTARIRQLRVDGPILVEALQQLIKPHASRSNRKKLKSRRTA